MTNNPDITTRGKYQNSIGTLPDLESYDFENIFKMCYDPDRQAYFYNIIKTVNIPNNINQDLYDIEIVPPSTSMTALSHRVYGTIKLWWLICTVNNISNPVKFLPSGTPIKVVRPQYVHTIVNLIKQNLVD